MRSFFIFLFCFFQFNLAMSEVKTSLEATVDSIIFQRPNRGVGKAGKLLFKTVNLNNNGIVLNINNDKKLFDSEIFLRPTFLGFTTQFGNFGFPIEPDSIYNKVYKSEFEKSKIIFDDNQLNISGEKFSYIKPDSNLNIFKFRLYCQNTKAFEQTENIVDDKKEKNLMGNCFDFMTINGNYKPDNENAILNYDFTDKEDHYQIETSFKRFDVRKNEINAQITNLKSISNNTYTISAQNLGFQCKKDENLNDFDIDKIKKPCLNHLTLSPVILHLNDKKENSSFDLNIKSLQIKNKKVNLNLQNAKLAGKSSTTHLESVQLNCFKDVDTDPLKLGEVVRDCLEQSSISFDSIVSSKPSEKDSTINDLFIQSNNNSMVISAKVKFLGLNAKVTIYGNGKIDVVKKILTISVTDTKLPLGINSVKLLMHFLKKNLISEDVSVFGNVITIAL